MLLNACSVRNKSCILRDLIRDNHLDLFFVTETWLTQYDSSAIAAFLPPTHDFYHFPREHSRGGGVGIAIKKSIKSVKTFRRIFQNFECLEANIVQSNKHLTIYIIYRPPQNCHVQFLEEFQSFLTESEMRCSTVIYLGDFNIWMNNVENVRAREFRDILDVHHLDNIVSDPTHRSGNILDLVITQKNSTLIKNLTVQPECTISDHNLIHFNIHVDAPSKQLEIIRFRNPRRICSQVFADLMTSSFNNFIENNICPHSYSSIDKCVECCTTFYRTETSAYFNEHAPIIEKTICRRDDGDKWFNSDILQAKRALRKAEKKLYTHKTEYHRTEFNILRQLKCNLVTAAKRNYYRGKIDECGTNSAHLQRVLNNLLGKNSNSVKLPACDDKILLANNFQNFFINKVSCISDGFTNVPKSNGLYIPDYPIRNFDAFCPVDESEVVLIINNMKKTYCSNDSYDLRMFSLDEVSASLSTVLSVIINASFETGVFPSTEKIAIVKPLLKTSKDPDQLSSYRPLYNTSMLAKILEKACLRQITKHLSNFEAIPRYQSAYRKFHSVETVINRIYNDLIVSKARGNCTMLVMLDLTAAFDTVNHSILLNDLKLLGIGGVVWKWFKSYLEDRKFTVEIGNASSQIGNMETGVPQGTILAPILFSIYTIELYHVLQQFDVSCHFYADDTQLLITVNDEEEARRDFSLILDAILSWMSSRRLKLNTDKTECIMFGSRASLRQFSDFSQLEINDAYPISLSNNVKDLGIHFDRNLSLIEQLKSTKKKTIGNLINISRITKFINFNSRIKLVHGLILSNLDFCNSIYAGLPNLYLHQLQNIINSAARLVVRMPRFSQDRITPVCIKLHFLPIKARIKYKICLLVFKALSYGQPSYIADMLKYRVSSARSLRNDRHMQLEEPIIAPSQYSNRCFSYCAPRMYNSLPQIVREAESIAVFKKLLKTSIFKEAYNLQDFTVAPSFKV